MAKSGSMILVILNIDLYQQSYFKEKLKISPKGNPCFCNCKKQGFPFNNPWIQLHHHHYQRHHDQGDQVIAGVKDGSSAGCGHG